MNLPSEWLNLCGVGDTLTQMSLSDIWVIHCTGLPLNTADPPPQEPWPHRAQNPGCESALAHVLQNRRQWAQLEQEGCKLEGQGRYTTSGHKGWTLEEQGGAGGGAGITCLKEFCAQERPTHFDSWTTPNSIVLRRQGLGPPKIRQTSVGVRWGESSTGLVWASLGSGLGYATYYDAEKITYLLCASVFSSLNWGY